jgi:putative endonuclease
MLAVQMPMPQALKNAQLTLLQRGLQTTARIARTLGRAPALKPHLLTGARGEDEALFYLRRNGYVIVAQQWKSAMYPGDIDLICWDGDCLCVVEVKARTSRDDMFTAEGAVDEQKRKALRRLARVYLRRLPKAPAKQRFDVVAVYLVPGKPAEFDHVRNAFAWNAD